MTDDYADRWFDFIDEYNNQSSVPLSYVLLPNPQTTGYRAMGSPLGMTTLSKKEWRKVTDNNAPMRNLDRGVTVTKNKTRKNNEDTISRITRVHLEESERSV